MNNQKAVILLVLLIIGGLLYYTINEKKTENLKSEVLNSQINSITKQIEQKENNNMTEETKKPTPQDKTKILPPKEIFLDKQKTYTAVMHTTAGDITIKLNTELTINTSNNFVYLAKQNFYDDTIFHRVMKGFMIQGGDPLGNGSGGPGYRFDDEYFEGGYTRGTVAMANAGPDTNGSQFFIMHQNYPLPTDYVIFAEVIDGIDIVDKIAESEVEYNSQGEKSEPINPVTIKSIDIIEE